MKYFEFYSTPGHGYLKVPLQTLRELQISQLLSKGSFIDAYDNVYCEEDCDMALVCTRMKLDGIEFEINNIYIEENDDGLTMVDYFDTYQGDYEIGNVEQRSDGLEAFIYQDDYDLDEEV